MNTLLILIKTGRVVVVLFSRPLVTAFTTAVAIHTFSSQVPSLLGYKVANSYGPLKLYYVSILRFN